MSQKPKKDFKNTSINKNVDFASDISTQLYIDARERYDYLIRESNDERKCSKEHNNEES